MLDYHTMRFCTDTFGTGTTDDEGTQTITAPFTKQALLIAKNPLDCSNMSTVDSLYIPGAQPEGSDRRIIFKIDNTLKYFSGTSLVNFPYSSSIDDVLKYGNTVAQLAALSNIGGFVGKKIYPIIALSAPSTAEDLPTIKFSIKAKVASDVLSKTFESAVIDLQTTDTLPTISEITAQTKTTGSGSVTIKVRLQNDDDTWTDYMNLADAADKEAAACQFKFVYKVVDVDSDSACVQSVTINHTLGQVRVSGNVSEVYSTVANYEVPLQLSYCTIRHDPLVDAYIEVYVNYMTPPKSRKMIQIGTATGSRQELVLGVDGVADSNIVASSIELYQADMPITDFSYNSEVSTVTLSAKKGTLLYASYQYERDEEVWRKMTLDITEPYLDGDGTYMSRYSYLLPDSEAKNKKISNVRIRMVKRSGTANNVKIGVATGKKQVFVLAHRYLPSTIKFTEDVDWTFDEQTHALTIVAAKDTDLIISGKWYGTAPLIYSFAAGWSPA